MAAMNEHVRRPRLLPARPETTRDGDGLPRRKWSVHDLERMLEAGIVGEGDRLELFGGDLIAMSPKGRHHEVLRIALNAHWVRMLPPEVMIAPETPFRLAEYDEPEPDFIVYPSAILAPDVRGDSVLLVVEIADSSLNHDLGRKAVRYAAFGVREYWVVNAVTRMTTVYRSPSLDGFVERIEVPGHQLLRPTLAPTLVVRLDDLPSA